MRSPSWPASSTAFTVSGDGTRLVVKDRDEVQVVPSESKEDDHSSGDVVTVDLSRARFQADPAALWRHAYAEAGRIMRRDFWVPDMSGVDWDGVQEEYRPLLDRIRGANDFTDLLWEVVAELGTSHAYITKAGEDWHFGPGGSGPAAVGQLGADLSRDPAGRWIVDRILPGESSDPRARSPLEAPGVAVRPGDELTAVDGQPVDPVRGPWPLLAGTAGKPVELTVLPSGGRPPQTPASLPGGTHPPRPPLGETHPPGPPLGPPLESRAVVVVPLRDERRLRYQDWVAGRRALVRELSDGRLGYLHIPDMVGEGWAHFHRDLRTEMWFSGLIMDVRGNSGGFISQLVVEKLARRVIAWELGRGVQPVSYPFEARRGPLVTVTDEFAGSDGDIVTAAIRLLSLGPVVGTRTWGGVIGIEGVPGHELVDGTHMTVPRYAGFFEDLRLERGELRRGTGRGGADHARRLGGRPGPAAGDRGPARAGGAGEAAACHAAGSVRQPPEQGPPAPAAPGSPRPASGRSRVMATGYLRYPHIHGDLATGPVKARPPLPPRPDR